MAALARIEAATSGSPQWKRARAVDELGAGAAGSNAELSLRRGSSELRVTVERSGQEADERVHQAIEHLDGNITYVHLSQASAKAVMAELPQLATASGAIFDLREAPRDALEIVQHLLRAPAQFSKGMAIPHIIRPGHTRDAFSGWETEEEEIPPAEPKIAGKVAFLIGPLTISFGESIASLVEANQLAALVGAPTGGTNGNRADMVTPSGCRVSFTGLRVTRQDGSQLHLRGIPPTIPASPTIAGIQAGRDEVRERAVQYVRTGS